MRPRIGRPRFLAIRVVLAVVVSALPQRIPGMESPGPRLDELKQLVKSGKYADAESGARALLVEVGATNGAESIEAARVLDVLVESLWRGRGAADTSLRELAEHSVRIKEKVLESDDADVATSLNNLAIVLRMTGNYADARPLYERTLAIREKALGPDHPDVAKSLYNLALLLCDTGNYIAARPLYERALAIDEKAFGPDHPAVASDLNVLGNLLLDTGDYVAARPLFERALAINEKALGPDHPKVADNLINLGNNLQRIGEYAAARPLYERALAINEKARGPNHPRVALNLNSLAVLFMNTGDYAAAQPLYERALAISEKALGSDHPDVALNLNNLANLLNLKGDYAAARPLYERALAIREKALGPNHPDVAQTLNNLASLLSDLGDYTAARALDERALGIWEKALGPDHPDVAASLTNAGVDFRNTGDYEGARQLFERALAINEKALGPDHPEVARSLNQLAVVHWFSGDRAGARTLYERALAINERALGPDHPDVAESLNDFAKLLEDTGDFARARPMYERALGIWEKAFGSDSPHVADGLTNLADLLRQSGDLAAARPMFERARVIREKVVGPDHPSLAEILNDLGRLLAASGDTTGAFDRALEAERIARDHLRLTGRSLSERQALQYAAVRTSGLDLALTLAIRAREPELRRRALDALVRSRAVVLDEMATRHSAISGSGDPQVARLAAALMSARTRLANLVTRGLRDQKPEIYRKLLDDARSEKEQAERLLAAASSRFSQEISRERLGIDELEMGLPAGSALVAFAQYQSIDCTPKSAASTASDIPQKPKDVPSYLAFVLRSGGRDPEVFSLGTTESIDGMVSRWQKEASHAGLESAYGEAGRPLRGRIWDSLRSGIGDATRIFIVPDGSLNLVNFAALPLVDGGYLIEHAPVLHYVSAERDLVAPLATQHGEGLLTVGAPSYDATSTFASLRRTPAGASMRASTDTAPDAIAPTKVYRGPHSKCGDFASERFEPLPATGTETREIARMWKRSVLNDAQAHAGVLDLRNGAASEEAVKRLAPGHRVLHLATHGFFLGAACASALASARGIGGLVEAPLASSADMPPSIPGENPLLLSGLVLAGANHRSAAADGEDDGILTAEEIASLDLSGVEWAVLSACETGIGDVRAGEGVFGLRRAFEVAGVRTLIMSLWSVDDATTRLWMKSLYEGRLEKKLDTSDAVQRASLNILNNRRTHKQSTHPFYWAGFIAAGDWR